MNSMQPAAPDGAAKLTDGDMLFEIEYGHRKELQPMGAYEGLLASALCSFINQFAWQHSLGVAVTEVLFVLHAERQLQRRPDVAFVSFDRWPERTAARGVAWNVVPDLAVEVVSPTNLAEEIQTKVIEYFEAGVRLAWVVYGQSGNIYVYRSPTDVSVLQKTDQLDGESVLPGFRLPILRLYEAVTKPQ